MIIGHRIQQVCPAVTVAAAGRLTADTFRKMHHISPFDPLNTHIHTHTVRTVYIHVYIHTHKGRAIPVAQYQWMNRKGINRRVYIADGPRQSQQIVRPPFHSTKAMPNSIVAFSTKVLFFFFFFISTPLPYRGLKVQQSCVGSSPRSVPATTFVYRDGANKSNWWIAPGWLAASVTSIQSQQTIIQSWCR